MALKTMIPRAPAGMVSAIFMKIMQKFESLTQSKQNN